MIRLNAARITTGALFSLTAGVPLLASPVPVAAQSASAAVVCVGSERQILQSSNPVRRVITEDVAAVYRVGVGIDDRQGMKRALIGKLGGTSRKRRACGPMPETATS